MDYHSSLNKNGVNRFERIMFYGECSMHCSTIKPYNWIWTEMLSSSPDVNLLQ